MELHGLLSIFIFLIVAGLIFYLLFWGLSQIPMPAPFANVAKGILILMAVIVLIYLLMGLLPVIRIR